MNSFFQRHRLGTPLVLCLALLLLTALSFAGSAGLQRTVTEMLIRIVMVVGLFIFVGHSGVMSFGHMAFVGIGAYGVAWTTMEPSMKLLMLPGLPTLLQQADLPWVAATLAGALLAALLALLAGSVILRLSGIAASIATFSLLAIFNVVYSNWDSVTAGASSIVGIPTPVEGWQALAFAFAAIVLAHLHSISRYGLGLRAVREEPVAAQSCGINAWRQLLAAFVLSAFVCGLGGGLDAQFLGVVNPDAYYLGRTFTCLTMLVIGGSSSLSGAVTGVIVLSALIELLVRFEAGVSFGGTTLHLPTGSQEIVVGVVMVLMLIRRPAGLMRGRDWLWPARNAQAKANLKAPGKN
ncbi:MAG: branched-chain amino acid ABC transporter permease [Rhodoferax sp.]